MSRRRGLAAWVAGVRAGDGRVHVHARVRRRSSARSLAVAGADGPRLGRRRHGGRSARRRSGERLGRHARGTDAAGDRDRRATGRVGPGAAVHVARRRHAAHPGADRPAPHEELRQDVSGRLLRPPVPGVGHDRRDPCRRDLRDALLAFQTGQVVGFYDPANGQLVYIGDTDLDQPERFILAHELTHALDDQHFGLRRLDAIGARCDDEAFTAGLGAIEGSAQYFATQALMRFPSDAPLGGGGDGGSLDAVPPFVMELQLWPYDAGHRVHPPPRRRGRHRAGGRRADHVPGLDGADHPPRAVAERRAAAGGRAGSGPRARRRMARPGRDDGGRGLAPAHAGPPAGRGRCRAGGRRVGRGIYRAWTDGSATAVVLRTVWDSPEDAQEFADAMQGGWAMPRSSRCTATRGSTSGSRATRPRPRAPVAAGRHHVAHRVSVD